MFYLWSDIVENPDENCETASVAELKVISELQQLGHDTLQDWANSQEKKKALDCENSPEMRRQRKKQLYWHTLLGKIEIIEQIFLCVKTGKVIRPFSSSAQIHCRGYSLPLQRAITDFGALRVRQLLYLGRPQDRTDSPMYHLDAFLKSYKNIMV